MDLVVGDLGAGTTSVVVFSCLREDRRYFQVCPRDGAGRAFSVQLATCICCIGPDLFVPREIDFITFGPPFGGGVYKPYFGGGRDGSDQASRIVAVATTLYIGLDVDRGES